MYREKYKPFKGVKYMTKFLEFLLKQSLKSQQFPTAENRVFHALALTGGMTGPTGRSVPLTSLKTHGHPWKPIGSAWLQGNWERLNPPRL
jgi:hypothetical protein